MAQEQKRIGIYPHGPMTWFGKGIGSFRLVFQKTKPACDTVDQWAYMSLGLVGHPILGRGVHAGHTPAPFSRPQLRATAPAVQTNGIPWNAQGINHDPLSGNPEGSF